MKYETILLVDPNIEDLRRRVTVMREAGWEEDGLWYTDHFKVKQLMKRVTGHNKDIWEI